jgi:hypothetical protein
LFKKKLYIKNQNNLAGANLQAVLSSPNTLRVLLSGDYSVHRKSLHQKHKR